MLRLFLTLSLQLTILFSSLSVFAQGFQLNSFGSRLPLLQNAISKQNGGVSPQKSLGSEKSQSGLGPRGNQGNFGGQGFIDYQIHILGQVEGPGTYRLPPSTRLDEALSKAGGVAKRGSLRRIELRRDGMVSNYDLFKFQRQGDLSQNPFLLDNDVIFVSFAENNVEIHGPVKSNSLYELTSNEKSVWDLVQLAGGYTVGVSEKEPVTVIRFNNDGKKELMKVPNLKTELEHFELLNGDIVIIPHLLGKGRRFDYDVVELPADNLYIPSQKNEIFVTGAVSQAGAFPYNPTYSVRDFVNAAGPSELSDLRSVYVLTSAGKYIKKPEKKKEFHLSPGDTVIVPKRGFTTDNVLKWYGTFTSSVFTGFAFKQLLFE